MTDLPSFDLQAHSCLSDGELQPAEVVAAAAAVGVRLLALSDHDTVEGVDAALDAGRRHGVEVVSAAELSAIDADGDGLDLHILGYSIDHTDGRLSEQLAEFRADRERRCWRMVDALRESGLELDDTPLRARVRAGQPLGRPHLAAAVAVHPANAERLSDERLGDSSAVLEAYLIPGRPGFRTREIPTVADAVAAIHQAGGVAVWAHPFWDVEDPAVVLATIERFRELGIDGVEAFYVTHTREQTLLLADCCERLGLLSTGSSDFHGPHHRFFSRFLAHRLYGREPRLGPIGA